MTHAQKNNEENNHSLLNKILKDFHKDLINQRVIKDFHKEYF